MKINYLTEKDILVINARVIQREGATGQKPHVRDAEALHFLVVQPKQTSFGQELYPSFAEKAGILLIKLVKKHVFEDANKRTTAIAFLLFLRRNSYELTCDWQELANQILKIAQIDDNELNYQEIYQWVNQVIHEN